MIDVQIPLPDGHISGYAFGQVDRPVDLMFFHATGLNARCYRSLFDPFVQDHHIVAIDQRGHGRTRLLAHPGRLTSWDRYAQDSIAVLQQLCQRGQRPPVLMGHSMGATLSLLLAERNPTYVRRLILCDPPIMKPSVRKFLYAPLMPLLFSHYFPIAKTARRRRTHYVSYEEVIKSYRGRGIFKNWKPGFLEDYVKDGFRDSPTGGIEITCDPAWESATFAAQRHNAIRAARKITKPIHMLQASHNSVTDILKPEDFHHPASRWDIIAGGHCFPMENPQALQEVMQAALREG